MKRLFAIGLLFVFQMHYGQFLQDKKDVVAFKGYFNFYYDNAADKLYLEIDKPDTEFLYVHALSEGVGSNDIGLDRGQLGGGLVVKFKNRK